MGNNFTFFLNSPKNYLSLTKICINQKRIFPKILSLQLCWVHNFECLWSCIFDMHTSVIKYTKKVVEHQHQYQEQSISTKFNFSLFFDNVNFFNKRVIETNFWQIFINKVRKLFLQVTPFYFMVNSLMPFQYFHDIIYLTSSVSN